VFWTALKQAREQERSEGQQCQIVVNYESVWFELSVARKPQVADAPDNFVLLARDVTESRQAQQELRQSRDELRALANRLQNGREEQRAHLAREIHDVLAQELTRLKIDLSWMQRRLGVAVDEPLRENLLVRVGQATALVDSSITTVQRIATELRPVILDSLGLFAALEWQVEDFAQRTGVQCSSSVPIHIDPPARDVAIVLFRILQESLTNIARHANATVVQVCLALESDSWLLTVKDNGIGMTQEQVEAHSSLGLLGMGERAMAIGGSVHFLGAPGSGTAITTRVPTKGTTT
jgi:signal transduction histidine kinase